MTVLLMIHLLKPKSFRNDFVTHSSLINVTVLFFSSVLELLWIVSLSCSILRSFGQLHFVTQVLLE